MHIQDIHILNGKKPHQFNVHIVYQDDTIDSKKSWRLNLEAICRLGHVMASRHDLSFSYSVPVEIKQLAADMQRVLHKIYVANQDIFELHPGTCYLFLSRFILRVDKAAPELAIDTFEHYLNVKTFDSKKIKIMKECAEYILKHNFISPALRTHIEELLAEDNLLSVFNITLSPTRVISLAHSLIETNPAGNGDVKTGDSPKHRQFS